MGESLLSFSPGFTDLDESIPEAELSLVAGHEGKGLRGPGYGPAPTGILGGHEGNNPEGLLHECRPILLELWKGGKRSSLLLRILRL